MTKSSKNSCLFFLRKSTNFIFDLIFPIECLGCGKNKTWFCKECFSRLIPNKSSNCFQCKSKTKHSSTCQKCKKTKYLNGVWSAGRYSDKKIEKLIKTMKYSFVKDITPVLGNYLTIYFEELINNYNNSKSLEIDTLKNIKDVLVVPVPLHKRRLKWRGFNQSLEIAKVFTKNLEITIDSSNLVKIKHTKPQAKLKTKKRLKNTKGSFAWNGNNLKNKNVILIDDVLTSGSTLNECAKTLKLNGAKEVWGLVIAQG